MLMCLKIFDFRPGAGITVLKNLFGNYLLFSLGNLRLKLSGLIAECGVIASWRRLAVSAGVSTISFRTASFTCGVGLRF